MHLCAVFVCHLAVKVSLRNRGPVSCQTVRDAAPLKGMLSGSFLSIISPATLIKAVTVHPHVPQAAGEKKATFLTRRALDSKLHIPLSSSLT